MSSPTRNQNDKHGSPTITTYEFPEPDKRTFCEYIYDSKEGTVLGRNATNWYCNSTEEYSGNCSSNKSYGTFKSGNDHKFNYPKMGIPEGNDSIQQCAKLLLFYVIFYAVLAGLFAISMQGLFATLDDKEPKWKLDSSIIGTNPGLGFRPLPKETERGSIIEFNSTKPETQQYWIDLLDDYLKPYFNKTLLPNEGRNQVICDDNRGKRDPNNVCIVDLNDIKDCSKNNSYGYKNNKPCIFLKLNKIFDWIPSYYEVNELPKEMPDDLVQYIKGLPTGQQKQVWVSCKGLHEHDEEKIKTINFPKSRGFSSEYYPYKNAKGYLSPLVPVQVVLKGFSQIINIECRAWAKNIIYSGSLRDRMGSVTFQIMIDN